MEDLDYLPRVDIPLFECGSIYFCDDLNKWQQAHEALGSITIMTDRRGAANTFTPTCGGKDIYLLGVFDQSPATLAHEAAHIVFDICKKVGIAITVGASNETFCHLLDYIVEFGALELKKPTMEQPTSQV